LSSVKYVYLPAELIFGFLEEYLAKATFKEKAQLEQRLYDELADIAALFDILQCLRSYRPAIKSVETMITEDPSLTEELDSMSLTYRVLPNAQQDEWEEALVKLETNNPITKEEKEHGATLQKFAELPMLSGPKNKEWLRQADLVRDAQGAFFAWARHLVALQNELIAGGKYGGMTERLELLSQDTAEQHVAQLAAERAAILDAVEDVPQRPLTAQPPTYRPQTEWSTSSTKETAKKLEALHLKQKVKTRPTLPFPSATADPPPAAAAVNTDAPDPEIPPPQPLQPDETETETYAVKPDSLRLFQ
jgi:hypothetical protein